MTTYVLEESAYTKNNIVMLWARDINTKEIRSFAIQNFKPYFFVPDDAGQFTSCYNTPLRKIECDSPADLKQRLPYFKQTFDADIPLDMRWRIDNKIMYAFDENFAPVELDEPLAPKVMFYDIEVQAADVFPTPELAEYPIVSIATYNTYNDDIKVFTTLPIKGAKQYKSEKGMIEAFARYIKTEDFDVISGWYNQSFDDPYIFNRAQKLYANIAGFSRTKQKRPWERDIFTTRTNIDLMEIFRAWSLPLGQQESYGLKFIARKFAAFEYDDFGAEIDELVKQKRFKALYEYACNDVIALARIDKACSLINFYENLRQMTGVKLNQVLQKTRIYEYYLMFCYDYPLPTRTTRKREPFVGAYVKEPTVGITENVGAVDLACVDGDTEVLTNVGWLNIKEITDDHKVASLNVETGDIEFVQIEHYHKYWYEGEMYKCDKQNVKFLITPNHRIVFNKHTDKSDTYFDTKYETLEIQELAAKYKSHPLSLPSSAFKNWEGEHYNTIDVGGHIVGGNDFFRFVGLWLADGHIGNGYLSISQCRLHTIDAVDTIVTAFYHSSRHNVYSKGYGRLDEHRYTIGNVNIFRWFRDIFGKCLAGNKYIPRWMLNASKENLAALWEGLYLGDGTAGRGNSKIYTTTSKQLADDVQELLLKLGYHANCRRGANGCYGISLNTRHTKNILRGFYLTTEKYNDYVYCLTTKYENFVMRRNGITHVTGNSLYPNIICGYNVSPDAFDMVPTTITKLMEKREELREMKLRGEGGANLKTTEQSLKYIINSSYGVMAYPTFKLYDMECAKFIPAKGQEIIKEIIKYLEDNNYNVIYGDTDSSYFAPVLTPEDGKKIEAEINEFLLDWGIKDGSTVAPKVKFETLYRRIFFKGKNHGEEAAKKRYIGHIVWEDGFEENKLGYKGIELKRSDVAPITKTAMTNFFSKLLIDGDEDGAIKYIVKLVNEICAGKIPLIELAIPRGVSNPNNVCPHNRGINNTINVLGLKLQRERKPQLIYCKRPVKEVVIDENMNEYVLKNKIVVDYETIMQKTIKNKFESIFKAIGRSWNKDIEFQCSLDRWM
jgi:DNA polymerase elongation subunit (family B)